MFPTSLPFDLIDTLGLLGRGEADFGDSEGPSTDLLVSAHDKGGVATSLPFDFAEKLLRLGSGEETIEEPCGVAGVEFAAEGGSEDDLFEASGGPDRDIDVGVITNKQIECICNPMGMPQILLNISPHLCPLTDELRMERVLVDFFCYHHSFNRCLMQTRL